MTDKDEARRQSTTEKQVSGYLKDLRASVEEKAQALRERHETGTTRVQETQRKSERHAEMLKRWARLLEDESPLLQARANLEEEMRKEEAAAKREFLKSRLPALEERTTELRARIETVSDSTIAAIQDLILGVDRRHAALVAAVDRFESGVDDVAQTEDPFREVREALKESGVYSATTSQRKHRHRSA